MYNCYINWANNMKSLLVLFLIPSISLATPDEKETQDLCKSVSKIYLNTALAAKQKVNYTDVLFKYSLAFDGEPASLYLIFKTAERAYVNTIEHGVSPELGADMTYNDCLYNDDDMIDKADSKIKDAPKQKQPIQGKSHKIMA